MKSDLGHLPATKQADLILIAYTLKEFADVEMILLYGSFARGNWVDDNYAEKGTTYFYKSDYDLLVVLNTNALADNATFTHQIDQKINKLNLKTPPSIIYHGIDFVNRQLSEGNYFFNEIRRDGIILHDTKKFNLANERKLNKTEIKARAERDFKNYFENASGFLIQFDNAIKHDILKIAAFELHQATERFYNTIQLVFTGYKPKTHDLEVLGRKVSGLDSRFRQVFAIETEMQKQRFILLKRAYIDARYDMDYQVSLDDLKYLVSRVDVLKRLTEQICKERIESL